MAAKTKTKPMTLGNMRPNWKEQPPRESLTGKFGDETDATTLSPTTAHPFECSPCYRFRHRGPNCWPLDNWVTPSAKIGSRPNKSPKRKKSENHHHQRRAGVRRWRRIRRPPARSIHRRQLPVQLLLDGILLRAGRRTGRGRETSGRQLPEWLARIGQQLFKERRPD